MKRFLALITVMTLLCVLLAGCTKNGNVSDDPNGSISSNSADKQTDASNELMPDADSRNDQNGSSGSSSGTGNSESAGNGTNGSDNGTNGSNENGSDNMNGSSTNDTDSTEDTTDAPRNRSFRRF